MEKALEIGKTSAAGSFKLFIGVSTSTIIMAVGAIILARLLSEAELGLYSAALTPSYMIILFRGWELPRHGFSVAASAAAKRCSRRFLLAQFCLWQV